MQQVREGTQFADALVCQCQAFAEGFPRSGIQGGSRLIHDPQIHAQGDDVLCGAVVKLARQPPALLVLQLQHPARKLAQRFFRLLALRDVLHQCNKMLRLVLAVPKERNANADSNHAALFMDIALLDYVAGNNRGQNLPHQIHVAGQVVHVRNRWKVMRYEFPLCVAGKLAEGLVHFEKTPAEVC